MGNWSYSDAEAMPIEIFRKWAIRVLIDNKHICVDKKTFDFYMSILDNPHNAEEADKFFAEHNNTPEEDQTASDLLISEICFIQYCIRDEYCGFFDFDTGLIEMLTTYCKEQYAKISKIYREDPLPESTLEVIQSLYTLKYENWLREEIYNHNIEVN